jgi:hypothetical protein
MLESYRITEDKDYDGTPTYKIHFRKWHMFLFPNWYWEYVTSCSTFAGALDRIEADKRERQMAKIKPRRYYVK